MARIVPSGLECFFLIFLTDILPTYGGHDLQYDYMARDYVRDHDPNAWSFTNVLSLMRPQCVPIPKEITLCRDVGYKNMSLPNLLGHDNLQEVKTQANPWVPLFKLRCHPNTDLFLCSLYAPVCLSRPIYPCRSLCESVKNSCAGYMKKYGFEWPDILKCDKFPTDDNMCIKQLVSPDNEAANVCTPCKQPITFESLLDSYCWSHFVLKVKIKGVERTQTGHMRILTKGKKRFYKPKPMNFQKEDVKNMDLIIHNGANCDCEAATNNTGKALLIGTKHGNIFNVTYISAWSKSKEFKKAVRAIRKKHDCKKEIESIANANNGGLSTEGKHVPGEDEALSKIESNEIGKGRGRKKGKGKGKGKDKGKKKNKGRKKKGKKKDANGKGNKDKDNNVTPEDPMANFAGIGCVPCKQPLVFEHLIKLYCDSNFAIKVKIKSVETDQSNGDKRLVTKKLRAKSFYRKENLSKRDIRKLQPVISGGTTCDCLSASPGKGNLFIMGTKRGNRFEISFLSEMVKDIGFISFVEAVEKGYTCNA